MGSFSIQLRNCLSPFCAGLQSSNSFFFLLELDLRRTLEILLPRLRLPLVNIKCPSFFITVWILLYRGWCSGGRIECWVSWSAFSIESQASPTYFAFFSRYRTPDGQELGSPYRCEWRPDLDQSRTQSSLFEVHSSLPLHVGAVGLKPSKAAGSETALGLLNLMRHRAGSYLIMLPFRSYKSDELRRKGR